MRRLDTLALSHGVGNIWIAGLSSPAILLLYFGRCVKPIFINVFANASVTSLFPS